MELSLLFIISAFVSGVLMFLAPCTLPLVPAYLAFISGVDPKKLNDPHEAKRVRRAIMYNGLAFVLGFSLVFVSLGVLFGFLGTALVVYQVWMMRIGGVLVILFGLYMLGAYRLSFLEADRRISLPPWLHVGNPASVFAIGGIFALGWTPCVGPILGSILLVAGTSGTALQGGFLLAIFSLGLALPFLFIAFAFSKATAIIKRIEPLLRGISIVGGVFLILLGLLLVTDNFALTLKYGYQWFDFLHYERLLDYL